MIKSHTQYDSFQRANLSMIFRLLGGLIRERLFPDNCSIQLLKPPFSQELASRYAHYKQLLCIEQQEHDNKLYVPIRHQGAFARYQMLSPVWMRFGTEWLQMKQLSQLVEVLRKQWGIEIPHTLEMELFNSLDFLAYGYEQQEKQKEQLIRRFTEQSIQSTQYIEALMQLKRKEPFDEYLFSEAMAVEGNPLHPCAKTRVGLSCTEKRYLPESCTPIPIHVLLIPKKNVHLTSTLTEDANEWIFQLSPKLKKVAEKASAERGVSLEAYQLFFVHPWQLEHTIATKYQAEWHNWIHLPIQVDGRALLSVRTMDVAQLGIHLKLPVQIQMTNAVRTLSPQATINGPILSKLCNRLLAQHRDFGERLVVLPELIGVYFQKEDQALDSFAASNLSYTIRQHPRNYIQSDELAFVGAALSERIPWKQPLIIDLIQQYVGRKSLTIEDAVQYIAHYAEQCLPPFLFLLQKYGIALEGHMQNVIIVTKQGRIQRILVRDMGGVRVHRERFKRYFGDRGLAEGPVIVEKMQEVYNKFLHSVLQNHLGELIFLIADFLQVPEKPLWERVAQVFMQSLDPSGASLNEIRLALFQPIIQTKALLSMRKQNRNAHDYLYIDLPNPLVEEAASDER